MYLREVRPENPCSVRVADGGWHFGYMGGDGERDVAKRIGVKVQAAAHQEYNKSRYLNEAFVRVTIDESYPDYLRNHQEEYDFLIAPSVGRAGIAFKKTKLACKKALRKVHGKIAGILH